MKTFLPFSLVMGAVMALTLMFFGGSANASGIPDGTYVEASNRMFYTFSGNKLKVGLGRGDGNVVKEEEGTYEIKDGKIFDTDKDGNTDTKGLRYTIEGDKLTLYFTDEGTVFTKR